MSKNQRIVKVLGAVVALLIIAAVVLAARAFGGGNITRAREIAARLQASAIANPNPVARTASTASPGTTSATGAAVPAATSGHGASIASTSSGARSSGTAAVAASTSNSQVTTGKSSSTTSAAAAAKAGPPNAAALPVAGAKAAPRRQPTSAEIAQAITAVNSLLPFFTPTPAQIASSGDQVCTALDHGQPFSQVASQALDMVGAGSISWMIPSSVPEIAIRTLVALYCPANASKLP